VTAVKRLIAGPDAAGTTVALAMVTMNTKNSKTKRDLNNKKPANLRVLSLANLNKVLGGNGCSNTSPCSQKPPGGQQ
jgi:hypothetical protein